MYSCRSTRGYLDADPKTLQKCHDFLDFYVDMTEERLLILLEELLVFCYFDEKILSERIA